MHFSQYLSTMIIKSILNLFGNLFQFTSMPNSYGHPMRIFTIISKVPFGHLKSQGYKSVVYEADSYLQGDAYQSCLTNILHTVNLLRELGFLIHSDKLLLTPSQNLFLDLLYCQHRQIINIMLPAVNYYHKVLYFGCCSSHRSASGQSTSHCLQLVKRSLALLKLCLLIVYIAILRELARILGNVVASFSAVTFLDLFTTEKLFYLKK